MDKKTITITSSRQTTIPVANLRAAGADLKGSKFYIENDPKTGNIILKRQRTLEEAIVILDEMNKKSIKRNPKIAENTKRHAGWEYEDYREEWDNSPEGKAYYKEKYGLTS